MLVLLMRGIYKLCCWNGLGWHDIHTKSHKDWFKNSKFMGGYTYRHIDNMLITKACFYFLKIREVRYKRINILDTHFEKNITKKTSGSCGPTSVVVLSVNWDQELTFLFNKVGLSEATPHSNSSKKQSLTSETGIPCEYTRSKVKFPHKIHLN
jgi:hypothetical protein